MTLIPLVVWNNRRDFFWLLKAFSSKKLWGFLKQLHIMIIDLQIPMLYILFLSLHHFEDTTLDTTISTTPPRIEWNRFCPSTLSGGSRGSTNCIGRDTFGHTADLWKCHLTLGSSWYLSLMRCGGSCQRWKWVVSNIFGMFTPKIGEDEPILTIIFFNLGWNNHLVERNT